MLGMKTVFTSLENNASLIRVNRNRWTNGAYDLRISAVDDGYEITVEPVRSGKSPAEVMQAARQSLYHQVQMSFRAEHRKAA